VWGGKGGIYASLALGGGGMDAPVKVKNQCKNACATRVLIDDRSSRFPL